MTRPDVVVVTGASAGLGRAIVREFARRGAHIGLIARGRERLEDARAEVERMGGRAIAIPADVADADAMFQAVRQVEETFGPIDILVNNAMTSVFSPVKEMTPDEFRRVTEVTYLGYVNTTLAVLNGMLERDRGVIVQVGSALAHRSIPLQAAYCAAKHAILGFTASLRSELIHDRSSVRVVMVQMPAMNTPQFEWVKSRLPKQSQPVPPIYQPEVGARAVVWCAYNDTGREVAVGWPALKAIIGEKFIPDYLDHMLATRAYSGQMTDEPADPDRPSNLWEPAPGDWAAHGRFDARSRDTSPEFIMRMNQEWLLLAGAGLLGLALGALTGGRDRHRDGRDRERPRPVAREGAMAAAAPTDVGVTTDWWTPEPVSSPRGVPEEEQRLSTGESLTPPNRYPVL